MKIRYAKGPVIYLYDKPDGDRVKELLWGDWLRIGPDLDASWSEVTWGKDKLAVRKSDVQEERLLEMIFLDVGQGDGCILTAPLKGDQERILIVDAGVGGNMNGYLNYRFRDFKEKFLFHAAVITHPDRDHYQGFQAVFDNEQVSFEHVYHNGLLERAGDSGPLGAIASGLLTDLRATTAAARALYKVAANRGKMTYPKLLWTALSSPRFGDVAMLSTEHGQKENGRTWMPGFRPSDDLGMTIEVLGPVVERTPGGEQGLRVFGKTATSKALDTGKTKNGHSILLRLAYRDLTVLFGGDLNTMAEQQLLRHYGNGDAVPANAAEAAAMVDRARARLSSDIMKTCHHGSADTSDEFLRAVQPAAFVISSGDEEGYVHPRPDLLGLLGKQGRGDRPLLLSTELLRSTREKEDSSLRGKLENLFGGPSSSPDVPAMLEDLLDKVFKRNVGVYGAINVRTDGRSVVIAFRIEKPTGIKRWFTYELRKDAQGILAVQPAD